ncbi:MAG: UDP-2,3-diacylglucosamine diphosphatase [Geobacteraceae bacterium]|nr:UDP-2,3-diacylglucosamine diphosphatase [Geobacteraceae bacterium]
MHAFFLADAHLRNPDDHNYLLMLSFLEGLPASVDMLVIVGDFFEFWIGDSAEAFPHYRPVLDAVERLTQKGVKLLFFEGNHDFHLGRYFKKTFNADVYPDKADITLDGKRLFICHGDIINRADYGYRALRLAFRNPFTRLLAKILPPSVPAFVADRLGRRSKGNHKAAEAKWDYRRLVKDFAIARFEEGFDVVVTAHYHRPMLENIHGKSILALGDWITQFSYSEWIDGKLEQKSYQQEQAEV